MNQLLYLKTTCTDPYRNLALEKVLMDHVQPGQCILYLWQNANTVVIGRNQCAQAECRIEALEAAGGHLARRLSGGGAVYHDLGNLNFTFLVRRADYDVTRQTDVILQAVRALGVPAVRTGRNDLAADGQKFSGHAYYRSGDTCYHHGTLMVKVSTDKLGLYLNPSPDKLRTKGVASVRSRVVNLTHYCPDLTIDRLCDQLLEAFSRQYQLPVQPMPEDPQRDAAMEALARQFADPSWLYGRVLPTGDGVWRRQERFGWGGVTLHYTLKDGALHQVTLHSDGLKADYLSGVPALLEGCPGTPQAIHQALNSTADTPVLRQVAQDLAGLILLPASEEKEASPCDMISQ